MSLVYDEASTVTVLKNAKDDVEESPSRKHYEEIDDLNIPAKKQSELETSSTKLGYQRSTHIYSEIKESAMKEDNYYSIHDEHIRPESKGATACAKEYVHEYLDLSSNTYDNNNGNSFAEIAISGERADDRQSLYDNYSNDLGTAVLNDEAVCEVVNDYYGSATVSQTKSLPDSGYSTIDIGNGLENEYDLTTCSGGVIIQDVTYNTLAE